VVVSAVVVEVVSVEEIGAVHLKAESVALGAEGGEEEDAVTEMEEAAAAVALTRSLREPGFPSPSLGAS